MVHPQQVNPIHTDNSTVEEIEDDTIDKKITKSMGMGFYWLQDRIRQGHYNVFCKQGATNLANYFTKNYSPHHHRRIHPLYIHCPDNSHNASFRVCYSSQNYSLNKYQSKTQIRKKAYLQKSKI